jgi:formylglycine-generating enzyme required for sulfatase activity
MKLLAAVYLILCQHDTSKIPEPEMIYIDGGTYTKGASAKETNSFSGRGAHQVTLSGFRISKYEITQALWKSVMDTNISLNKCPDCPVEEVSYNDIQSFIRKLDERTHKHYSLPTDAQWEFAARGGNKTKTFKYAGSDIIDEVAWYGGERIDSTHPVGHKQPNELGIHDMSGNVAEICSDWWDPLYFPNAETDPPGPPSGKGHIVRGGNWGANPDNCGVLAPGHIAYPDDRNAHIGFRLVLNDR